MLEGVCSNFSLVVNLIPVIMKISNHSTVSQVALAHSSHSLLQQETKCCKSK